MNRITSGVLVGVVALTISACGSSMDPEDLKAPVDEWVGPAGGRVQLAEGGVVLAELWIPAGALSTTQHIVIRELPQPSPAQTPQYSFEPAGLVFAPAAVVTVSFPTEDTAANVYWTVPLQSGEWDSLPGAVSGGQVSARIDRLAVGHGGPACSAGTTCTALAGNDCKVWAESCFAGTRECVETDALRAEGAVCRTGVCAYSVDRDAAFCVGSCNTIDLDPAVLVTASYMGVAPADPWSAGTIAEGTYHLTALEVYAETDPGIEEGMRSVWKVTGTTVEAASEFVDGVQRLRGSWTNAAGALNLGLTCPQTITVTFPAYSAADTELRIEDERVITGVTKVRVYTKQP